MGTQFYGKSPGLTHLQALIKKSLADADANSQRMDGLRYAVQPVDFDGIRLHYDRELRQWYYEVSDMLLAPPASLLAFVVHGFDLTHVRITKNYAVVGARAPFQGEYTGRGKFEGCTAKVDNRVEKETGPRQEITVTGPISLYAAYYSAIRSRRCYPDLWLEPEPGWLIRILRAIRVIGR